MSIRCIYTAMLAACLLAWPRLSLANDSLANDSLANDTSAAPTSPTLSQTAPLSPARFTPRMKLSAQDTHSGLSLPRWVSLKYDKINGRKGPGTQFTHLWTFERQGMPVIVVNEMENWRKIRDIEGGESWVRKVALSGQDTGIIIRNTPLMKKPKASAPVLAQLSPNLLLILQSCTGDYCEVEIDPETTKGKKKGRKGFVARRDIWGTERF